jgi:hypothetical protein
MMARADEIIKSAIRLVIRDEPAGPRHRLRAKRCLTNLIILAE